MAASTSSARRLRIVSAAVAAMVAAAWLAPPAAEAFSPERRATAMRPAIRSPARTRLQVSRSPLPFDPRYLNPFNFEFQPRDTSLVPAERKVETLKRVVIPSIVAAVAAALAYPIISLFIKSFLDAGA